MQARKIRDRDSKFSRDFDTVFASKGIRIITMPVRAPKANAIGERFVRTARADCLDWLLIVNRAISSACSAGAGTASYGCLRCFGPCAEPVPHPRAR